MEVKNGNITFFIEENYEKLSERCASIIKNQIVKNPRSVLGLATGSTPTGTYERLVQMHKTESLDFSGITAFNLDEYYPIKKDNAQSYDFFMKQNLFNRVNADANNLHIPNGEIDDPNAECERYENLISNAGGIDLQLLGLGANGHIGFNEPDSVFGSSTRVVTLDNSTIEANSRFFGSFDEVPKRAITMGIKTIMLAKEILIAISGAKKAEIALKVFFEDVTPRVPASVLQLHHRVYAVLDKEAASFVSERLKK